MQEAGRRGSLFPAYVYPPFVFLKSYLIKMGFKDGSVGFIISVLSSYYVFLKYAKLWELARKNPRSSE
jgi:hypothetical protein